MKAVLGLVILIGLGAVVGAIVIGQRSSDDLVVEAPYERGLAWDQMRRAREESGLSLEIEPARFTTGSNRLVVFLRDARGPVRDAEIELLLTRPHTAAEDLRLDLTLDPEGGYWSPVVLRSRGAWELHFTVHRGQAPLEWRRRIWAEP